MTACFMADFPDVDLPIARRTASSELNFGVHPSADSFAVE
jgi:hypothetical protein